MKDEDLDSLIRQTLPNPVLPDSFQRDVWARIAVTERNARTSCWPEFCEHLFRFFARPAVAASLVIVMIMVGAGLGTMAGSEEVADARREAYIASINPISAAHSLQP